MRDLQKIQLEDYKRTLIDNSEQIIIDRKSKLTDTLGTLTDYDTEKKGTISMKQRVQLELDAINRDPNTWLQLIKAQVDAELTHYNAIAEYKKSYEEWLNNTASVNGVK